MACRQGRRRFPAVRTGMRVRASVREEGGDHAPSPRTRWGLIHTTLFGLPRSHWIRRRISTYRHSSIPQVG
eukprot:6332111-Pyramimonas_sp.AAC.1